MTNSNVVLGVSSRLAVSRPALGRDPRHHLYDQTFQRAFNRAVEQSGVAKPVTPHTLRQCFATHLMQSGSDIRTVQELLGHSNVATPTRSAMRREGMAVCSALDRLLSGSGPVP